MYSPNWPLLYTTSVVCKYYIYGLEDAQHLERVNLRFEKMDINASDSECQDAFVKVYLQVSADRAPGMRCCISGMLGWASHLFLEAEPIARRTPVIGLTPPKLLKAWQRLVIPQESVQGVWAFFLGPDSSGETGVFVQGTVVWHIFGAFDGISAKVLEWARGLY